MTEHSIQIGLFSLFHSPTGAAPPLRVGVRLQTAAAALTGATGCWPGNGLPDDRILFCIWYRRCRRCGANPRLTIELVSVAASESHCAVGAENAIAEGSCGRRRGCASVKSRRCLASHAAPPMDTAAAAAGSESDADAAAAPVAAAAAFFQARFCATLLAPAAVATPLRFCQNVLTISEIFHVDDSAAQHFQWSGS